MKGVQGIPSTIKRSFSSANSFGITYGPGGRSSNSGITATVFGGYGFVGRYYASELGSCGTRVYAPFRGDELEVRHLKPMFDLGQLGLMPFSLRDKESILESMRNSDVVVNFIGKHYETKHLLPTRREDGKFSRINYSFEDVHVTGAAAIAELAKEAGVKSFIQISSLSASEASASRWSRTKMAGENAVRAKFPDAIIVKLSTVYGSEDRFLNWIAEATSRLPFYPLVDGGKSLVQPVNVSDVAKGLLEITKRADDFKGKTFQFAGPAEYSHKEVAEFVQDVILTRKPLIDVPVSTAHLAGSVLGEFISPVLTTDMVAQLSEDVIEQSDSTMLNLTDLGIERSSMDRVAFDYLHRFRRGGHFTLAKGYH